MALINSLKHSLFSGELSDVQFMVGRQFGEAKPFSAHKYVLSLRSPVFRAMLYGTLAESAEKTIDIPDDVPDAFSSMLNYLYTDSIEDLTVDNVCATWMCADKYDLPLLVDICCDYVTDQLSVDNCLTILEDGIQRHAEGIIKRCLHFIDGFAERVLRSEHFSTIGHKALVMILGSDTLFAVEQNIYLAVEKWAQEACKAKSMDSSGASRRQMLGEALFLVRFPLLSNAQLADGPAKSGLLLPSELHDLYQYQSTQVKSPSLPFSTEQRRAPSFRIGNTVLQYKEKVFVQRSDCPDIWCAGEVVGATRRAFRCKWYDTYARYGPFGGGSGEDSFVSEKILRAAEFMIRGQEMLVRKEYTYTPVLYSRPTAQADYHVVQYWGSLWSFHFHDLAVADDIVTMFRATGSVCRSKCYK
ncbi:BTB/POZ domain-containing protein 6-like [Paramacrobiotus metropolitanus]|uniref:BTB/POZ domain-containing protein 6-like n=1 Tax=Paramacrobiotus metropolitanus TaxID=2943436 RepID=UPI002445BAAD|nr:BTB/POZ domain-containing protein 6-like [Paramacrobiotus metropolitanus]